MHFDPLNRLIFFVLFSEPLYIWAVRTNQFMAPHTGVGRRNSTRNGPAGGRVTIFTWNLSIACMKFMAEWNRLCGFVTDVVNRVTWGPHPPR